SRRGSASPETALPLTVRCSVLVCDAAVVSLLMAGSFGARVPRRCSAPGVSAPLPLACDTLARREYHPSAPATPWRLPQPPQSLAHSRAGPPDTLRPPTRAPAFRPRPARQSP